LIGFTIASGIIIYYFSITLPKYQTAQISNQSSKVISCAGAGLEFKVTNCNLDKGLVLWLPLDDVNSTNYTLDFSGYGNDGKLFNYPCNPATCNLTSGVLGKALSFDGVNDYVNAGNSSIFNSQAFSVVLWLNSAIIDSSYDTAIHKGLDYDREWGILRYASTNGGGITAYIYNSSNGQFELRSIVPEVGRWYHGALTFDGQTARLYINGTLMVSRIIIGNRKITAHNLTIGSMSDPTHFWNGTIDEVRIYNRALTEEEINQLYYNELNNKFNISLQLVYPLGSIANSIGKDFTAIVFLKNGTIIQKDFSLDKELGLQNPIVNYNLTIDGYYPSYGFVDKIKICSKACSLICYEVNVNGEC